MKWRFFLIFAVFWMGIIPLIWLPEVTAKPLPSIEVSEEQQYSIAFIQRNIPIYLSKNAPLSYMLDTPKLRRAVIRQAQHHPYIRVLSDDEVESRLGTIASSREVLTQAEIDIGYADNLMSTSNYVSATTMLQRTIRDITQAQLGHVYPQLAARAWQMLAYAYIAQLTESDGSSLNLRPLAKLAFIELIRFAPHLTMLAGRQSPERVAIYDEALETFLSNPELRKVSHQEASSIASKLKTDILVWLRVVQNASGALQIEVDYYRHGEIIYGMIPLELPEHVSEDQLDTIVSDSITAWLSNQYDCLTIAAPKAEQPAFKQFMLGISPTYSVFLHYPTSNLLHSVGAFANFTFRFSSFIFIRAGLEAAAVLPDPAHELYEAFMVFRIPVMFGLSQEWRYIRGYVALGAELTFTTEYTITKSIACKTFGTDDIECNRGDVIRNRNPLGFQIPFVLGMNAGVDPFYVTLETFISATVYPFQKSAFRNPVGLRLGVEYLF